MIKQLVLLMILIGLLLLVSEVEQTTIQVMIVIPSEWVPYLDWWLSFPGWQKPEDQLPYPQEMVFGFHEALLQNAIPIIC